MGKINTNSSCEHGVYSCSSNSCHLPQAAKKPCFLPLQHHTRKLIEKAKELTIDEMFKKDEE